MHVSVATPPPLVLEPLDLSDLPVDASGPFPCPVLVTPAAVAAVGCGRIVRPRQRVLRAQSVLRACRDVLRRQGGDLFAAASFAVADLSRPGVPLVQLVAQWDLRRWAPAASLVIALDPSHPRGAGC